MWPYIMNNCWVSNYPTPVDTWYVLNVLLLHKVYKAQIIIRH